jgi:hypothetical protein
MATRHGLTGAVSHPGWSENDTALNLDLAWLDFQRSGITLWHAFHDEKVEPHRRRVLNAWEAWCRFVRLQVNQLYKFGHGYGRGLSSSLSRLPDVYNGRLEYDRVFSAMNGLVDLVRHYM